MSIWKDTRNPKTKLTNRDDFLQSSEITQACKDSYSNYINTEDTTRLPVNKAGYPQTNWSYIDYEAGYSYKATYNEDYGWGVMRNPAPEGGGQGQPRGETAKAQTVVVVPPAAAPQTVQGQRQQGAEYVHVTNGSKDQEKFVKSSPKSEASLAAIADSVDDIKKLLAVLVEYMTDKQGIQRASDMVQK